MSGRTAKARRRVGVEVVDDDGGRVIQITTPAMLAEGIVIEVIIAIRNALDVLIADLDTEHETASAGATRVIAAGEVGKACRALDAIDKRRVLPKHRLAIRIFRVMRDELVRSEREDDFLIMATTLTGGLEALHHVMLYQNDTATRNAAAAKFLEEAA